MKFLPIRRRLFSILIRRVCVRARVREQQLDLENVFLDRVGPPSVRRSMDVLSICLTFFISCKLKFYSFWHKKNHYSSFEIFKYWFTKRRLVVPLLICTVFLDGIYYFLPSIDIHLKLPFHFRLQKCTFFSKTIFLPLFASGRRRRRRRRQPRSVGSDQQLVDSIAYWFYQASKAASACSRHAYTQRLFVRSCN